MNKKPRSLQAEKIGKPPGTLMHVGAHRGEEVRITAIDYSEKTHEQFEITEIEDCLKRAGNKETNTWINIDGLHDVEVIRKFGEAFKIDPLVLEDILNTEQRPKAEDHLDYFFIVARMLIFNEKTDRHEVEQVSIILGENYLLTFQERPGDVLDPVRQRLKNGTGRLRRRPGDYLAYAIVDTIVDNYLHSIERSRERLEDLEDRIVVDDKTDYSDELHLCRRELTDLRRIIWPMKEVISAMQSAGSELIKEDTVPFLRDTNDHVAQYLDVLDGNRELQIGLRDIMATNISNRMNEVMKVLTIIATIFIPLTFLAGIYGMNFAHMPELAWPWAYPVLLGIMAAVAVGMVIFFKRKKWL